jgi:hypothetical protein
MLKIIVGTSIERLKVSRPRQWCELCGRQLVYLKPADTWICWECNWSPPQYVEQAPSSSAADNLGVRESTLSGKTDRGVKTTKPFIKSYDPRKRLLAKQNPDDVSEEDREYMYNTGARLVAYEEHVERSDEVIPSDELKERGY